MSENHHKITCTNLTSMLSKAERHIDAGQLDSAALIYAQLLTIAHDDSDLHHTLGLVYLEQGRTDLALFHIGRSIELNPQNAVSYRSMGDAFSAAGQYSLAISAYEKACSIDPGNTDAWLNLGNIFHELDIYDQAKAAFQKIIDLAPGNIRALNNLAKVHHDMGQSQRALAYYNQCLKLQPEYAEARFNRATLLLALGEFEQGWAEYEWRFKRSGSINVYPHQLSSPRWQGESYRGRRLLVHCEQGMGDILQFARYLPMVKQRGGTLILEAHAPLVPLLRSQTCIDELIAFNLHRPPDIPHDLHIPLMSLPHIFGTTMDSIPDGIPYIKVTPESPDPWQAYLKKDKFNIGLVWAASDLNPKRNCPIDRCGAWFRNSKLHYIGLQKGKAAGQIEQMKGCSSMVTSLGERLHDFRHTADVIAHLDLMISVDTAAAHLAGAMGIPLWVLLPHNADWRWPPHRENSPWYPKAKLFRQPGNGDWNGVINDVITALRNYCT